MAKKNPWIKNQVKDHYYQKSKAENHRARSYYKIKQIDQKYRVFRMGKRKARNILDLGAAPGAWLEYIKNEVIAPQIAQTAEKVLIAGVDLSSIRPFDNCDYIQTRRMDIFKPECESFIQSHSPWDVILSDLAPKTAGDFRDEAIQEDMVFQVIKYADFLRHHGNLVAKIFQSQRTNEIVSVLESKFRFVKRMKPSASRPSSRELYVVALDFQGAH